MRSLLPILLVFLGGGVGSVLRYLVALGAEKLEARFSLNGFPLGTFFVNVFGCFAIGLVMAASSHEVISKEHRILLAIGVLGGFTTFSTFAWQAVSSMNDGQWPTALLYVLLSNALGFAAAVMGARLATLLLA